MPMYYDENGNEVEALSMDEVNTTLAQKEQEWQSQVSAKEQELANVRNELAKLENKDFNFSQLRKLKDMSDEEKAALSSENLMLLKRQEALEEQISSFQSENLNSTKENALKLYTRGMSEEDANALKDKVEAALEKLRPANSKQELVENMRIAYTIATGGQAPSVQVNPFGMSGFVSPTGPSGSLDVNPNKPKGDPEKVKSLAGVLGFNLKDE